MFENAMACYSNSIRLFGDCCPRENIDDLKTDVEEFAGLREKGLECRLTMVAPKRGITLKDRQFFRERRGEYVYINIENTSSLRAFIIEDIYLEWCGRKYAFLTPEGDPIDIIEPKEFRYGYLPIKRMRMCDSNM